MQIYNFRRFDLSFSKIDMKKYSRITTHTLKEMKVNNEKISMDQSGLSKREWNELMEAFEMKDKVV